MLILFLKIIINILDIECPDISILPAMAPLATTEITRNGTLKKNETAPPKITIGNRGVGGKAIFSCPDGFLIEGESEAVCQSNGQWSNDIPLCKGTNTTSYNRVQEQFPNFDMRSILPSHSQFSPTGRNWNNNRWAQRKRVGNDDNNDSVSTELNQESIHKQTSHKSSGGSANKNDNVERSSSSAGGGGHFPMARH